MIEERRKYHESTGYKYLELAGVDNDDSMGEFDELNSALKTFFFDFCYFQEKEQNLQRLIFYFLLKEKAW